MTPIEVASFRSSLGAWYARVARTLPWRGIDDPYLTWVSEVMLQQTRVAAALEHYARFTARFPTLQALAAADETEVLAAWSGLGYYRRARMLHRAVRTVVADLDGRIPRTAAELRVLPGIGEYTSAAIASIAFGESVAVVDGNVERVLLRVLGGTEDRSAAGRQVVRTAAALLVPRAQPPGNAAGDHNQAMMELGATLCVPRSPLCLQCPVVSLCRTRGEHPRRPRAAAIRRDAAFLLAERPGEVLLVRRAPDARLMPNMWELPELALEDAASGEPLLTLRHAITDTLWTVRIYRAPPPAAGAWHRLDGLDRVALTGLARKVLRRLRSAAPAQGKVGDGMEVEDSASGIVAGDADSLRE